MKDVVLASQLDEVERYFEENLLCVSGAMRQMLTEDMLSSAGEIADEWVVKLYL